MTAPRNTVLVGDARQQLAGLPTDSADMVLTSPPYFRLRDYAVPGQLGLETTIDQWVDELQLVTRGLHRVLKPTGTLWLNLGDSYSLHHREGAPRKSLLLGPERLAHRLVADGWILRNKLVWAKPNPVPTSVRDRLNCSHEFLYLFARSPRYYFNLDAIRTPHRTPNHAAVRPRQQASSQTRETWRGPNSMTNTGLARLRERGITGHPLGKNPGDVWTITPTGYRGAHQATFPLELARRAIQAGCPPDGLVLDPFLGAGTTAVAAEQLDRDWLGIELNPTYAALSRDRLAEARAGPKSQAA